jgi:hypothetical protein
MPRMRRGYCKKDKNFARSSRRHDEGRAGWRAAPFFFHYCSVNTRQLIGVMDPILEDFLSDPAADLSALHDVARIRAMLEQAAREGRSVSYSELLLNLGFRFTRPKMRALCRTLDEIDRQNLADGALALAVLVVREGDGLPGQGWWTGRTDYDGPWTGPEAAAHIASLHHQVFAYWRRAG